MKNARKGRKEERKKRRRETGKEEKRKGKERNGEDMRFCPLEDISLCPMTVDAVA